MSRDERKLLSPNLIEPSANIMDPIIAQQLLANDRFIAAIDAYRLGLCNMTQALRLAFEELPFSPPSVDSQVFTRFVLAVGLELRQGTIKVSEEASNKFKAFYQQQDIKMETPNHVRHSLC